MCSHKTLRSGIILSNNMEKPTITKNIKMPSKQRIPQGVVNLINKQIQRELESSHLYWAIYTWLNFNGYLNSAEVYKKYAEEERSHADKFIDYLLDKDIKPIFPATSMPSTDKFVDLVDVLNASRTYIGKKTLDKYYSEHTGLDPEEFSKLRTYRNKIYMSECISDLIKFKTPEMNKMLDYFKSYSVGSVDEGIEYLVLFKGKGYQMGFGGLHSVDRPKIYKSTDMFYIMDADVNNWRLNLLNCWKPKSKDMAISSEA